MYLISKKSVNPMKTSTTFIYFLALLTASWLTGCSTTAQKKQDETQVIVNDFPTQDRVEYVLECVAKHGGLKYETLYPCICTIDKLATQMTYKEYAEAKTFTYLRSTPGEKGGIFRDPAQAKTLRKKLEAAEKFAEDSCFVKM